MAFYSGSMSDQVDDSTSGVNGLDVNSMAQEIDKAFSALRVEAGQPPLKGGNDAKDRRMLFIAIARGMIAHLKRNDSTSMGVSVSSSTHTGSVTVTGS